MVKMIAKYKSIALLLVVQFVLANCGDSNGNNNNNNREKSKQEKDIWEQDLTDTFKIEGTDQGIQKVNLKCGSNSFRIVLETENPFNGVMYTRGSFYKQQAPCFVKPTNQNARSLEMQFQLNECQTLNEGELYSNVVVIQNDPELITPGDSAFQLECDFRQPRNVNVEADMQARDRTASGSSITLTSPDPSVAVEVTHQNTVRSDSDRVEYTPKLKLTTNIKEEIHFGTVEDVTLSLGKDEL